MTDSSTGGTLLPAPDPAPLEDQSLEDFVQSIVAGVTGMPGAQVLPRWQEEPPNIPSGDWASVGITAWDGDKFPYVTETSDGLTTNIQEHEEFEVLCSFYGPHSSENAARLKQGLAIPQNREALFLANMALVEVGRATALPTLLKQKWLKRIDRPVTFRRLIQRSYPVLTFLSATAVITLEASSGVIVKTVSVKGTP